MMPQSCLKDEEGAGSSNNRGIQIHKYADEPSTAWQMLSALKPTKRPLVQHVRSLALYSPIQPDHVRVVCISDTHNRLKTMVQDNAVPHGDVLIHAGDFTMRGSLREIINFSEILGTFSHPTKIVIAGNHELSLDAVTLEQSLQQQDPNAPAESFDSRTDKELLKFGLTTPREAVKNCIYLQDSFCESYGYKVYGSPWQPVFRNWAFNLERGEECLAAWNLIPDDTEILITHGPPIGHGDRVYHGTGHAGCVELLSSIEQRIKPLYHVFGHIHEGYGVTTNKVTTFVNASICDVDYQPVNPPIIFDLPMKPGWSRNEDGLIVNDWANTSEGDCDLDLKCKI